jgi:thiamine-phosphate pyrophosphorylase
VLPLLNAIVDAEAAIAAGWSPLDLARAYLAGGARFLQVRAKKYAGAALLDLAAALVAAAKSHGAVVIVNDRADVARLAHADGVHLGQEDLSPQAARAILGPGAIIGRSTHSVTQLEAAATEPVDYVAVGPVFTTATKETGYDAVGLELIRRAAAGQRPVVAIGGVTLENAPRVVSAGAASVAVISDLLSTRDPVSRVAAFLTALRDAPR